MKTLSFPSGVLANKGSLYTHDDLGLALDAGVPLDLGLVGGVHGQPQEEAADDDAPDCVSLSHVL